MVCPRCIAAVEKILRDAGLEPLRVELGSALLPVAPSPQQLALLRTRLEAAGFELLDDRRQQLIEQVRTAIIELVHYKDNALDRNLSDYLSDRCRHDYGSLSKLFSESCGISIERYYIAQKVERIKELLIYGELTLTQIADLLHYSSSAHLSAQFRLATGLSPSRFRKLHGNRGRLPLDKV